VTEKNLKLKTLAIPQKDVTKYNTFLKLRKHPHDAQIYGIIVFSWAINNLFIIIIP
jgi:hypothetical protein